MAEYIELEAAIATACKGCNKDFPNEPCEPADCAIQQGLFKIPAADVVEVRHGEWGDTGDFQLDTIYSGWKCSECGFIYCGDKFNYCPECGAKMDGKDNGG